tara:strand:+ start:11013 stop:12143 length:1131 start_codon:yes stop_codon:yes gene_type:complete
MKTLKKQLVIASALCLMLIAASCSSSSDEAPNQAPEAFTLIAVTDGAIGVDVKPTFTWNAAVDPDGDTITYELLMDANSNPTTSIASNINSTSFTLLERLPLLENLFWRVVATDQAGNTSASNTFSFTTRNLNIPAAPVTDAAGFSKRVFHTSVVFNNKTWVIAGSEASSNYKNDVWSSPDGVLWTQTTLAPFSTRGFHTSVVFNDKIWVIGGRQVESNISIRKNDVWSSPDGVTWTEVTTSAPFLARNSHTSVVFNDKIWVIAGWSSGNNRENDVWSSSDGMTWTSVTTDAAFSKRGAHTSVVFDNKIWVIGGEFPFSDSADDVWSSADGLSWSQAIAAADFFRRTSHTSVVSDDKIWLIAGFDGTHKNDVWFMD